MARAHRRLTVKSPVPLAAGHCYAFIIPKTVAGYNLHRRLFAQKKGTITVYFLFDIGGQNQYD